jgi:hypothetical protein
MPSIDRHIRRGTTGQLFIFRTSPTILGGLAGERLFVYTFGLFVHTLFFESLYISGLISTVAARKKREETPSSRGSWALGPFLFFTLFRSLHFSASARQTELISFCCYSRKE